LERALKQERRLERGVSLVVVARLAGREKIGERLKVKVRWTSKLGKHALQSFRFRLEDFGDNVIYIEIVQINRASAHVAALTMHCEQRIALRVCEHSF
jgi:hypothetical protein